MKPPSLPSALAAGCLSAGSTMFALVSLFEGAPITATVSSIIGTLAFLLLQAYHAHVKDCAEAAKMLTDQQALMKKVLDQNASIKDALVEAHDTLGVANMIIQSGRRP